MPQKTHSWPWLGSQNKFVPNKEKLMLLQQKNQSWKNLVGITTQVTRFQQAFVYVSFCKHLRWNSNTCPILPQTRCHSHWENAVYVGLQLLQFTWVKCSGISPACDCRFCHCSRTKIGILCKGYCQYSYISPIFVPWVPRRDLVSWKVAPGRDTTK